MRSLKNRVAIVTGASSPYGMGRAAALRLAREGAQVAVVDLVTDGAGRRALDKVAAEIEALGVGSMALACDVGEADQVAHCVAQVIGELGGVDILFNNAGVGAAGLCEETPLETFDRMYRVNTRGTIAFTKQVIVTMKQRGGGSIINNASIGGLYGDAHFSAYDASKFAVVGFTRAVALELGRYNIRVNAICPGLVDTEMGQTMLGYFAELSGDTPQAVRADMTNSVALGRWGKVEEIAAVVAFLAGDEASYITGIAMPVAGGYPPAL